jgi:hypothetical protein
MDDGADIFSEGMMKLNFSSYDNRLVTASSDDIARELTQLESKKNVAEIKDIIFSMMS